MMNPWLPLVTACWWLGVGGVVWHANWQCWRKVADDLWVIASKS
jgi:hypothetical protein